MKHLDSIVSSCNRRFAEKADMKRAIKNVERQLSEFKAQLSGIATNISMSDEERPTDAMLAKKPLGGWSCASCHK